VKGSPEAKEFMKMLRDKRKTKQPKEDKPKEPKPKKERTRKPKAKPLDDILQSSIKVEL
jgi:hypothetical protein